MNRSIKTVIQVEEKRFSNPIRAAKALAAGLANDLAGPEWPEDDCSQTEFDAFIDAREVKTDRIEERAYPRYLKVCKRILA